MDCTIVHDENTAWLWPRIHKLHQVFNILDEGPGIICSLTYIRMNDSVHAEGWKNGVPGLHKVISEDQMVITYPFPRTNLACTCARWPFLAHPYIWYVVRQSTRLSLTKMRHSGLSSPSTCSCITFRCILGELTHKISVKMTKRYNRTTTPFCG